MRRQRIDRLECRDPVFDSAESREREAEIALSLCLARRIPIGKEDCPLLFDQPNRRRLARVANENCPP